MTDNALKDYHRNGVRGLGFSVGIAEGALCVEFEVLTDEYENANGEWVEKYDQHRIAVNLDSITELESDGNRQIPCLSDCGGSAWLIRGHSDHAGTFVAMYAPDAPERATAVLRADLLPVVEFGVNSWRGDYWYSLVKTLHETAREGN